MRATMKRCLMMVTAVAVLGGIDACGTADEIFDCQSVCSRYADCYDPSYDVDACRSRCRTASEKNSSVRSNADQCNACIGDKSCLSATFSCGGVCGSIVP
jgi:hypothetical protein